MAQSATTTLSLLVMNLTLESFISSILDPPSGLVVIQEYQIDYRAGRESRSAFSYILDEDGQIWQWGFERFDFGPKKVFRISLLASLGGLIIGCLLPVLIVILLWRGELQNLFRNQAAN